MRKSIFALALVGLLALGGQAVAVICTIDAVPAATLLLPYFEVDLSNPNGLTTLFSVNNASATAVLAHVVVWSDLSAPVLDFNIYLTGYDVQSVNLRDIFVNGNLPQTASAGQDPTDTISPKGIFSQDINFASCTGQLPPPALPANYISHVQLALTGQEENFFQNCYGQALGDNIARGYITIDTVNSCTLLFPDDVGYFGAGGSGVATNQNVLWGDWFIVNTTENLAEGADLVHIEADATNPATSTAGRYTFYGRYDSYTAIDNREPLATTFATRYINGGVFSGGTSLLVWRDSKQVQTGGAVDAGYTCPISLGVRPPWYPLGQEGIVIFNEEEQPIVPQSSPFSPQPRGQTLQPFPAETQRVQVGGAAFPINPTAGEVGSFDFGWLYLDLNTTVTVAPGEPPVDPAAAQAYVYSTMTSNGHFGVALDGIRLDSACAAQHFVP
jgi:hypothetical protein